MATFCSLRGLEWHYETSGSGDALVFIHGFGGSLNWWRFQAEEFQAHHQLVLIDLPGHGQSSWMALSIQEMAADIIELVGSLGIEQCSIVASSFGGLIAMDMYRQYAQAVMRISFVGSIPKFARGKEYPAGLDVDKIRTLSNQFSGDDAMVMDMFFRSLFTMKERNSEQFKLLKKMRAQEPLPHREVLRHYLKLLEEVDLRERVSKIICPLQFISGEEDYICPKSVMEWMAQHTYNARFDHIKGCGHLPFLTEVKEYNRLLEDFLLN